MRCNRAEHLLVREPEQPLSSQERAALAAHLLECAACRATEEGLTRALTSLNRSFDCSPPPTDLWSGFVSRLAVEVSCAEFRDELGTLRDGACLPARARSLQAHQTACAECDAAAHEEARALSALERFGATVPARDLWPAFSERLAETSRRPVLSPLVSWLAPPRVPWPRPAWVLAAPLAVGFMLTVVRLGPGRPRATVAGPQVAAVQQPAVRQPDAAIAIANAPIQPAPEARRLSSSALALPARAGRSVAPSRPVRLEVTPLRGSRLLKGSGSRRLVTTAGVSRPAASSSRAGNRNLHQDTAGEAATPVRVVSAAQIWADGTAQLDVALYVPATEAPIAPEPARAAAVTASAGDVMPEAVEAIRLLAGVADAASSPFQPTSNQPSSDAK